MFDNLEDLIWHEDENHFIFKAEEIPWKNFVNKYGTRTRLSDFWKRMLPEEAESVCFLLKNVEAFFLRNKFGGYDLHRDFDKPALIHYSGVRFWYKAGNPHRNNGPAMVNIKNEAYDFCVNGKWHRENNEPAIYHPKWGERYYVNHKLHRTNGPAIPNQNRFFLNGKEVTEEELNV